MKQFRKRNSRPQRVLLPTIKALVKHERTQITMVNEKNITPDTQLRLARYVSSFDRSKYAKYKSMQDFLVQCPFYMSHNLCNRAGNPSRFCGSCVQYHEMQEEIQLRTLRKTNPKEYYKRLRTHAHHEAWL